MSLRQRMRNEMNENLKQSTVHANRRCCSLLNKVLCDSEKKIKASVPLRTVSLLSQFQQNEGLSEFKLLTSQTFLL